MVYQFKAGRSLPVEAQVVGDRLTAIANANDGDLTPRAVVEDARPEDAVLHPCFEWDDEVAAGKYREDQARTVIRSIVVVDDASEDGVTEEDESTVAWVSIGRSVPDGARYVATSRAMGDDDMRGHVLADALRQLEGFKARYRHLSELAGVMEAIDQVQGLFV